jgi:hypothetical protein
MRSIAAPAVRRFAVVYRSSVGPARRVITVSDAEGYSRRRDDEQRDLQNLMSDIQDQAASNAGLNRRQALAQGTGDGSLTAWPPETSELVLLADYVRELRAELDRVNLTLRKGSRIRLRLAITAGLVEEAAQGFTGQAVIKATLLANSDELREALRKARASSLAVIIDDKLFEDVVMTGRRGLRPDAYRSVVIRGKDGAAYAAWITVPGSDRRGLSAVTGAPAVADAKPVPAGLPGTAHEARHWRMRTPVKAALIGAGGVIVAAAITSAATSFGSQPGGSPTDTPAPSSGATVSATISPSASPSASASPAATPRASTSGRSQAKLYWELTDNHLGTDVFSDPMGDAVTAGQEFIPYHTNVQVKCWAPNESGMGSINVFYLVETPPWAGEYAPANTFLNADTSGSLDPDVPECPQ